MSTHIMGFYEELTKIIMSPNRRSGGMVLVRIPSAFASATQCSFFSGHYLLNHMMDLDQTCTDTLLGGVE